MNLWQKLKVGWAILFGKPSIPAIEEMTKEQAAKRYQEQLIGNHLYIPELVRENREVTEAFTPRHLHQDMTYLPNLREDMIKDKFIPLLGLLVVKRLQEERTEVQADWVDYEMVTERVLRDYPDDLGTLKWVPELTTQLSINREPSDKKVVVQSRKEHIVFCPSITHVKPESTLAKTIEGINQLSDTDYKLLEELRLNKLRLSNLEEMRSD